MSPVLRFVRLPHNLDLPLPSYETSGSAGMDLPAAIEDTIVLESLERTAIPTGLQIAIPDGFEGQVRPRSGLAFRHGLTVTNAPGTIDADYRGEVGVILINHSKNSTTVSNGDRIAQLVFNKFEQIEWENESKLSTTKRGDGGFGSTGIN